MTCLLDATTKSFTAERIRAIMRKRRQHQNKKFLLNVGEAIRFRRLELSLSQEELGTRCTVHRTYITEIENGMRNISLLTLQNLAQGLRLKPWQLLRFEGNGGAEQH